MACRYSLFLIPLFAASTTAATAQFINLELPNSPAGDAWNTSSLDELGWTTLQVEAASNIYAWEVTISADLGFYEPSQTEYLALNTPAGKQYLSAGEANLFGAFFNWTTQVDLEPAAGEWSLSIENPFGGGGPDMTNVRVIIDTRLYEPQSVGTITSTADTVAEDGELTLREALLAIEEGRIVDGFTPGLENTLQLPPGRIEIAQPLLDGGGPWKVHQNVTLVGAPGGGTILSAEGRSRVLEVEPDAQLILVDVAITNGVALPPAAQPRISIIGGEDAAPGDYPFMASLHFGGSGFAPDPDDIPSCGGAVIASTWVLTASHCVVNQREEELVVVTGRTRIGVDEPLTRVHNVTEIIMHPDYNNSTLDNDVALLRLETPAAVPPIALARPGDPEGFGAVGQTATVIGWGVADLDTREQTADLQEVDVPIVSSEPWGYLNDTIHVVAGFPEEGGKDSCQGDSGGPLFVHDANNNPVHIGVVSFGTGDCAEAGHAGVYARTSTFAHWIQQNIIEQGGGIFTAGDLTLINSLVYGNQADQGSAIGGPGNVTLLHATIAGNDSPSSGSAPVQIGGDLDLRNTNIWGNTPAAAGAVAEGTLTARHSNTQGAVLPGAGNRSAEPRFDGPGDYRLSAPSVLIDAGLPEDLPPDTWDRDGDGDLLEALPLDLDGNPRTTGAAPDIGAYEFLNQGEDAPDFWLIF